MKSIETPAVITTISSRQDGSLRLSVETPEYSSEAKAAMMDIQGLNVQLLITPTDEKPTETFKVDTEAEAKTPSQRLRAVIYLYFKQSKSAEEFETYYRKTMERVINQFKLKLEEL